MAWIGIGTTNPGNIATNGNVGIGVTNPGFKLDILMADGTGGSLPSDGQSIKLSNYTQVTNTYNGIKFASTDGLGSVPVAASIFARYGARHIGSDHVLPASLGFATGDNVANPMAERMTINYNGNVGIGVTNPGFKLDILMSDGTGGSLPSDGQSIKLTNYTAVANTYNGIKFASTDGMGIVPVVASIFARYGARNPGSDHVLPTSLGFATGDNVANPMAERMTINYNGNVGIGVTNPGFKLDILMSDGTGGSLPSDGQSIKLTNYTQVTNTYNGIKFASTDGMGNVPVVASIFARYGARNIGSDHVLPASLGFATGDNVGNPLMERMTINYNGNVGIGTNSPQAKLEIGGSLRISDGSGHNSIVMVPPPTGNGITDRDNINNTINSLPSTGGTVILQQGTYVVNKISGQSYAILLKQGVQLSGSSMTGTILQPNEADMSIFYLDNPLNQFVQAIIQNLHINNTTSAMNLITGINIGNNTLWGGQPISINNVKVTNCKTGILVASWFTEINNCLILGCEIGINLLYSHSGGTDYTNATFIRHCSIWGSKTGIYVKGNGNMIIGNDIGNLTVDGEGILVEGVNGFMNSIIGNYIESNSNAKGISIACPGNYITGNLFDVQADKEILFDTDGNKRGNNVFGNYFMRKSGGYTVTPLQTRASLRVEVGYSDGTGKIYTPNGGSTTATSFVINGTGTITSSGNIVTSNTTGAFNTPVLGARITANGISRIIVNKTFDSSNNCSQVQVDGAAPNWSLHSFTYEQPIFAGLASGTEILTSPGTFAFILSITNNFSVIMDRTVNWFNGGNGIEFLYKLPLLDIVDDSAGTMTSRVVVRSRGSVGIGTTAPAEMLHVNGNLQLGLAPSIKWTGNNLYLVSVREVLFPSEKG